ncbi:MAG: FtsQ-type POTRA domain-containing protein [Clostridiales bacterium]|nr:FtsQ-type POTRA domain-containing protein [Clostridiales bacterium]
MMRNKRLLIIFGILLSITLLIAIGSAIFSIRTVNAFCNNVKDEELCAEVAKEKDNIIGKSVFTLNEDKLIKNVEERVGGIKVVNIERLFPNRVNIHFVKLYDYFEVMYEGNFYISGIDGKILKKQAESGGDSVIRVVLGLTEEPKVGGTLESAPRFAALQDMINMLELLDFRETDAPAIISTIDIDYSNLAIYVFTRTGVLIKIQGDENAGQKLRYALSLYTAKPSYRTTGLITVTETEKGIVDFYDENGTID